MRRRGPAGEARQSEVEAAPEEMHRAHFADEAGTERLQHMRGLKQRAPEPIGRVRVVGRMHGVLLKGDRIGKLARHRPDRYVQSQRVEPTHQLAVEIGDRHGLEREVGARAVARPDHQAMVDEIEIDGKMSRPVRHGRRRKPAAGEIERDLPPMVLERREREPDLAHDLRPHMQGGAAVLPVREGDIWPAFRVLCHHRLTLTPFRGRANNCE
jgi:hypothetical protein